MKICFRYFCILVIAFAVQNSEAVEDKKHHVDFGVSYTAQQRAALYAKLNSRFETSTLDVNSSIGFYDKYASFRHLFPINIDNNVGAVGYSATFRNFEIVPTDKTTQNQFFNANLIGIKQLSPRDTVISTVGVEHIKGYQSTNSALFFPVSLSYETDTRAKYPFLANSYYFNITAESSFIGEQYIKGLVHTQYDIPVYNEIALSLKGVLGTEYGNNIPMTKRFFYLENRQLVRGYSIREFGYNKKGVLVGGKHIAATSVEVWTPFFHDDLKGYLFFDAGVMNGYQTINSSIKTSVGAGLSWDSPVGIINIFFGKPLSNSQDDKVQNFGINLGTFF